MKKAEIGGIELPSQSLRVYDGKPRVSPIQIDVLAVLRVMYGREKVLSEHSLDSGLNLSCDVYVPHLGLVVEIDGPTHFVGRSLLYTARTAFRTGLQRDCGFKTVNIYFDAWNNLKGLNSKMQFLSNLIDCALKP